MSTKNIEFLNDLKSKDSFYSSYRQTMDELEKLREAHSGVISMIKNHHIVIEDEEKVLSKFGEGYLKTQNRS